MTCQQTEQNHLCHEDFMVCENGSGTGDIESDGVIGVDFLQFVCVCAYHVESRWCSHPRIGF